MCCAILCGRFSCVWWIIILEFYFSCVYVGFVVVFLWFTVVVDDVSVFFEGLVRLRSSFQWSCWNSFSFVTWDTMEKSGRCMTFRKNCVRVTVRYSCQYLDFTWRWEWGQLPWSISFRLRKFSNGKKMFMYDREDHKNKENCNAFQRNTLSLNFRSTVEWGWGRGWVFTRRWFQSITRRSIRA
jgi:hypothetical protein